MIIATQSGAAAMLWLGTLRLFTGGRDGRVRACRKAAVVGLTLGLLLYIVGFVTVGGERFAMWQPATWNG